MQKTRIKRNIIRTARRKKRRYLLAVLFFLLLLFWVCKEQAEKTVESGRYVRWETDRGIWQLPSEEFLIGALAASVPGYYREETIKAQAVILRSISLAEDKERPLGEVQTGSGRLSYLDREQRKQLWQQEYEEYEAKFSRAVQTTAGIVLEVEGQVVSPPYFRLSAGYTRDGGQLWEDGRFWWCKSVECPHDLEAADYLQTVSMEYDIFWEKLKSEGISLPQKGGKILLNRDSTGYVLWAACGGQRVEGERFRTLFGLASASFEIGLDGENLIFTTKGVGHGLGFDQYAADLLAAEGWDYQQLLFTFFDGVTLEKVE